MKKILFIIVLAAVVFLKFDSPALAQFDWLKKKVNALTSSDMDSLKTAKLSDTRIGEGLKEALKVGINNTVSAVGKKDGYFNNEQIKLLLPEKLQKIDKAMRLVGFDEQMDELVLSMNRAAESAAPQARDIFLNSLFDMPFEDAQKIFKGENNAATEYFRKTAYPKLYTAFKPAVDASLNKYDVTSKYKVIIDKYQSLPLAKNFPAPSIDDYVVSKSLDGLFLVMGEEEKKIRTDPTARVTNVLKEVFGQ
ncbi:MAG: DUF4197 domain-containing protein [Candidatus Omnitrophota bacterium]